MNDAYFHIFRYHLFGGHISDTEGLVTSQYPGLITPSPQS